MLSNQKELTVRRLLSIYWLLVWRGYVGGAVLGAAAGFVLGLAGGSPQGGAVVGGLIAIPWSFFVLQMMLRKKYLDFRIVLEVMPAPSVEVPMKLFNKALAGALVALVVLVPLVVWAISGGKMPTASADPSKITNERIYDLMTPTERADYSACFQRSTDVEQRRACWTYYSRNYRQFF